ncbi:glycoside hydrolase family 6 protein [Archangium violaceum]|uniref:glycoside hydrolase family 6 protein n=1 Tax=Archangium violaceum TaxID=83451 RepID=UPI002B2FAF9D|nr:glycoside hydrolase family 6 protein [Archangium gephyra]
MVPRKTTLPGSPRRFLSIALTLASAFTVSCGPVASAEGTDTLFLASISQSATTESIVNGAFSSGSTAPWWNSSNTQSRVENGLWRLDVASGSANAWDAMAGQSGLALVSGRAYTLSFTASASASVSIRTTVQLDSAPYTATLDKQVALDGTSRRYSFPFTSSVSSAQGQVTFQLGGRGALTVRLDDISLTSETGSTGSGPIAMTNGFYTDSNSNPAVWARNNGGDGRAALIQSNIASRPMARWFGNWNPDIASAVSSYVGAAAAANKLPILVAYNIPGRDCGSHSGGGAGTPDAYRSWISAFASGLGNRPAIVIIEPDALAQLDCLPGDWDRQTRVDLLRYATEQLRDRAPNTWAYMDGGNARWIAPDTMAQRLQSAGVSNIRGFVANVSNFYTTAETVTYGNAVNAALSSRYGYTRPFVVDTSRNGNGSNGEWCNPGGRKLGTPTQAGGGAELLLWVKVPGDSDGQCGIAPGAPAGQFDPEIAWRLIHGT